MTVQTDHRPLEMITRKPLQAAPRRLQRMLMRLQRYQLVVIYKPGIEMVLADTLSRAYLKETGKDSSGDAGEVLCVRSVFEMEMESINAVDCPFISSSKIQDIRKATAEDHAVIAGADDHHLPEDGQKEKIA